MTDSLLPSIAEEEEEEKREEPLRASVKGKERKKAGSWRRKLSGEM